MNPTIEKIVKLPKPQRLLILVGAVLVEAALFFFLLYSPALKQHKELESKLGQLRGEIAKSRDIANNYNKYKENYDRLKKDLEQALTELPDQKEIPSLLTSISQAGRSSGLDFLIFRPKSEVRKEFYAEVPVELAVSGSYRNVAGFFIAVGNLPRIVNIQNVSFADVKVVEGKPTFRVNCLATTFRFLDPKEVVNVPKKKK